MPIILRLYIIVYWHDHCIVVGWHGHCKYSPVYGCLYKWIRLYVLVYTSGSGDSIVVCTTILSPIHVRTCLYNHLWCTLQSKRQAPTATSPVHNIRRGNPLFRRRTINFRIPQRTPLNFQTTYVARLKSVDPAPFSQSKMPKTRPPKTPLNGLFTTNRIPVPPLFYTLFKRQKSWRIL